MAMTPIPVLDRTSATFKADVDTFFGSQLPAFAAEANALQADVATKQGQAATSAANAATSEGNALASKNAAAISATNAATSEGNALASKNAAAGSFASLDTRYLGAKAVVPTLDNAGAALLVGALYWDTALPGMRSWNGSAWVTLPAATAAAISNTPAGSISATTVQAAINELATERFGKDNILGTVSQAAGVPTGAVIERGSNANGEYVRLADGTQICSRINGQAYYDNSSNIRYDWTYPASFASVPVVVARAGNSGLLTTKVFQVIPYFVNETQATCALLSVAQFVAGDAVATTIHPVAIGRWF